MLSELRNNQGKTTFVTCKISEQPYAAIALWHAKSVDSLKQQ